MRTEEDIRRDEVALENYKVRIELLFARHNNPNLVEDVDIRNNWISLEDEIKSFVDITMEKDRLNPRFKDSFKETLLNLGKELHKKSYPNLNI